MMVVMGPGTHFVRLNSQGKPTLLDHDGNPVTNPTFETIGDATLVFEIETTSSTDLGLRFIEPPITWTDLDGQAISPSPPGSPHNLNSAKTALTVYISNPYPLEKTYNFKLRFNLGDIPDPTIIEKPAEPPPHPED